MTPQFNHGKSGKPNSDPAPTPKDTTTKASQSLAKNERVMDPGKFLRLLHDSGAFEVRGLQNRRLGRTVRTVSRRFRVVDDALPFIRELDAQEGLLGVYVTLNPLRERWAAEEDSKAASDADIDRRRWLMIDFDPVRDANTNSTWIESLFASTLAAKVQNHLHQIGWPDPILCGSGNGSYLLYRVDLPNDKASENLIRDVLSALARKFNTSEVEVDRVNFNASRLLRVMGTLNRKGPNHREGSDADRPQRRARFVLPEKTPAIVTPAQLHSFIESEPLGGQKAKGGKTTQITPSQSASQDHHLESVEWYAGLLDARGVPYERSGSGESATLAIECPVCSAAASKKKCTIKKGDTRLVIACGKCSASGESLRNAMQEKGIPWVSASSISEDAHLADRDLIYSALLAALPLSEAHVADLTRRGFTKDEIQEMGIRSWSVAEAATLSAQACERITEACDAGSSDRDSRLGCPPRLAQIPGIRFEHGVPRIDQPEFDCMVIPSRDSAGRIIRLRLRVDNPGPDGKYRYYGSDQSSARHISPLVHVPIPTPQLLRESEGSKVVTIAEGELKAEFVVRKLGKPAISMAGCSMHKMAFDVAKSHGCSMIDWAFDADHRENPAVAKSLLEAIANCRRHGTPCRLLIWDEAHKGIDDLPPSARDGIRAIAGTELNQYLDQLATTHNIPRIDMRWQITITPQGEAQAAEAILDALSDNGYYRMPDGRIARLNAQADDFDFYSVDAFPSQVDRVAVFQRPDRKGDLNGCKLPAELAKKAYHRTDYLGISQISAILDGPGILPDGQLVLDQGFHEPSGVFVRRVPPNWSQVTEAGISNTEAAALAAYKVLAGLFQDYNFVGKNHPTVLVAAMLSIVGRLYIRGRVPIFAIVSQQPRSGKTLAADVLTSIPGGRPAPSTAMLTDPSQFRSDITTQILSGRSVIVYDNVAGGCTVTNSILAQIVTTSEWRDRKLHTNTDFSSTNIPTIVITGNSLSFSQELARRTLIVELRRQTRTSFTLGELTQYVRDHQAELLKHLLTIWAWIIAEGAARQSGASAIAEPNGIASFPEFSRLVVGPIWRLTGCDIGTALGEGSAEYDGEVSDLAEALEAISTLMRGVTPALAAPSPNGNPHWPARQLHYSLVRAERSEITVSDAKRAAAKTLRAFLPQGPVGASHLSRFLSTLVGVESEKWRLNRISRKKTYYYALEQVATGDAEPDSPAPAGE